MGLYLEDQRSSFECVQVVSSSGGKINREEVEMHSH